MTEPKLVSPIDTLIAEIERLRAAGDAAFYAMCAYRDDCDTELFQDAIDALGTALRTPSHDHVRMLPAALL